MERKRLKSQSGIVDFTVYNGRVAPRGYCNKQTNKTKNGTKMCVISTTKQQQCVAKMAKVHCTETIQFNSNGVYDCGNAERVLECGWKGKWHRCAYLHTQIHQVCMTQSPKKKKT